MPPFALAKCPACKHINRFDLAELRSNDTVAFKFFKLPTLTNKDEEFSVTCKQCGRKFKLTWKGGDDDEEK